MVKFQRSKIYLNNALNLGPDNEKAKLALEDIKTLSREMMGFLKAEGEIFYRSAITQPSADYQN